MLVVGVEVGGLSYLYTSGLGLTNAQAANTTLIKLTV